MHTYRQRVVAVVFIFLLDVIDAKRAHLDVGRHGELEHGVVDRSKRLYVSLPVVEHLDPGLLGNEGHVIHKFLRHALGVFSRLLLSPVPVGEPPCVGSTLPLVSHALGDVRYDLAHHDLIQDLLYRVRNMVSQQGQRDPSALMENDYLI